MGKDSKSNLHVEIGIDGISNSIAHVQCSGARSLANRARSVSNITPA